MNKKSSTAPAPAETPTSETLDFALDISDPIGLDLDSDTRIARVSNILLTILLCHQISPRQAMQVIKAAGIQSVTENHAPAVTVTKGPDSPVDALNSNLNLLL